MKIADFVKREPRRAGYLFIVLAVGFFTCFSALVAGGGMALYAKAHFADTNAALVASDVLSLRRAMDSNNDMEKKIYTALLQSRTPFCLEAKDVDTFERLLVSADGQFYRFCTEIESAANDGSVTRRELTAAVRALNDTDDTDNAAVSEEAEDSPLPKQYDPVRTAENHFGIQGIFHPAAAGVYCKNLYVDFEKMNGSLLLYACATLPKKVTVTEREAVQLSTAYAQKQHLSDYRLLSAVERYGIWWIELASKQNRTVKIGVRGDTGSICFYFQPGESNQSS